MRGSLVLLALVGCAAPEEDTAPEAPPSRWDPAIDDPNAVAEPEAVQARLQQAIDSARQFEASPIVEGYLVAAAEASEACPTWYGIGELAYWYDTCTTDGGATFDGYVFEEPAEDSIDYVWTGMQLWGAATLTTADGRVMHVGGRVESTTATGQGTTNFHSRAQGSFRWDGVEADGTWLGEGYDLDLDIIGTLLADGSGGRALSIDGGISGFTEPLSTVRFEAVQTLRPSAKGALETTGMMSARDADGRWYQVEIGAGEAGCGPLVSEGVELGEVCLDFAALADWDDTGPW